MPLAPIILFAYNRPKHTRLVLQQLKKNKLAAESLLYIFVDGPKTKASATEIEIANDVKKVIREELWCMEVIIQEAEHNLGLAKSVINGVTEVVNKHGKVIVLEDDHLTDIYFLDFMNDALAMYQEEERVACISGYIYPVKEKLPTTFFIKGADCWGWATWKRAWNALEKDGQKLLDEIESKKLEFDFDFFGAYPYTQMLKDQIAGKNNSWAILWYASAYLKNELCLYPGHSLIENIGNDGSGTHAGVTDKFNTILKNQQLTFSRIKIAEDIDSKKIVSEYFSSIFKTSNKSGMMTILRKYTPPLLKKTYRRLRNLMLEDKKILTWSGNYNTWNQASLNCTGYDNKVILEKVKQAVLKVKRGEALYERDSVTFDEPYIFEPVLKNIQNAIYQGKLHVVDFGGSLGSTYFQYRSSLQQGNEIKWAVVEQANYVEAGKNEIANEELLFFHTVDEALKNQSPGILLLLSVLQFIQQPFELVEKLLQYNFEYILIDRTGFIKREKDRLTIQNVPKEIYEASYPCWFFNEEKFLDAFLDRYELQNSVVNDMPLPMKIGKDTVYWKGFCLKRKHG